MNVDAIYIVTIIIGFGLAGLAGGVLAANQSLSPALGDLFIIQAFAVVIVGGGWRKFDATPHARNSLAI